MADFPYPVTYGTVVGQFLKAVVDSSDPGTIIDAQPMDGSVTFRAEIDKQLVTGGLPSPFTLFPLEQTFFLDSFGRLANEDGSTDISLIASDSLGDPTEFTYTVTVNLIGVPEYQFSIFLPSGSTLDLTLATPVDPSGGVLATTDELMAYIFNQLDSEFRAAVIAGLGPLVAGALADNPTVVTAVNAAITAANIPAQVQLAISNLNIVLGDDARLLKYGSIGGVAESATDIVFAPSFPPTAPGLGRRYGAIAQQRNGLLPPESAKLVSKSIETSIRDLLGYEITTTEFENLAVIFGKQTAPQTRIGYGGFTLNGSLWLAGRNPFVSSWPGVNLGDSTAYGIIEVDSTNLVPVSATETWWYKFQDVTGSALEQRGQPGATIEEIAMRANAALGMATVAGDSIPATGSVNMTAWTINPLRASRIDTLRVGIWNRAGEYITGTLSRLSSATNGFVRDVPGSVAMDATGGVEVEVLTSKSELGKWFSIIGGINNEGEIATLMSAGKTQDQATTIVADKTLYYYQAIVSRLTAAKAEYVLQGIVADRGLPEAAGTPIGDYIRKVESGAKKLFGSNFLPIREYIASQRALDDAQVFFPGFTPTSADNACIAAGVTPPSLRTGPLSVHLGPIGNDLQGRKLIRYAEWKDLPLNA